MTTPSRDLILTPPSIPTTVVVAAAVIDAVADAERQMTEAPLITDQASFDAVRAVMVSAQATLRLIDGQRQLAKGPWFEVGKAIDAAARPFIRRCEAVKDEAKSQMEAFLVEQDRLKAEAERARAVAEAAAAAMLAPGQAPQLSVQVLPQQISAPVARWQEIEVFDKSKVPDDFLVIDWPKVRSHMEIHGDNSIPGIRFKTSVRVVAR